MVLSHFLRSLFQRSLHSTFAVGLITPQNKSQSTLAAQPTRKLSITYTCKVCNSRQVKIIILIKYRFFRVLVSLQKIHTKKV